MASGRASREFVCVVGAVGLAECGNSVLAGARSVQQGFRSNFGRNSPDMRSVERCEPENIGERSPFGGKCIAKILFWRLSHEFHIVVTVKCMVPAQVSALRCELDEAKSGAA
eukprot:109138-Pleurochrysis_carterae.AAC.3